MLSLLKIETQSGLERTIEAKFWNSQHELESVFAPGAGPVGEQGVDPSRYNTAGSADWNKDPAELAFILKARAAALSCLQTLGPPSFPTHYNISTLFSTKLEVAHSGNESRLSISCWQRKSFWEDFVESLKLGEFVCCGAAHYINELGHLALIVFVLSSLRSRCESTRRNPTVDSPSIIPRKPIVYPPKLFVTGSVCFAPKSAPINLLCLAFQRSVNAALLLTCSRSRNSDLLHLVFNEYPVNALSQAVIKLKLQQT
ncbi:hypothetical protein J6590_103942 [Homalodisca vitripennis]|nr:hypothetical protein J6590_103942 [Homalodisca vitripennis]